MKFNAQWGATAAVALALIIAPAVFYPVLVMKAVCFALFALSFNLLLGHVGLLSFGHAAFFGTGAYLVGYVLRDLGLPTELGLLAALVGSGLLGLFFGWLAIRKEGIYFSMITLGLGQMIYFLCLKAPITGGEDGMQGIPRGLGVALIDLSRDIYLYYYILAIFFGCVFVMRRIIQSPFGELLLAIGQNERRAMSLGYDVRQFKLITFTVSAAFAGLAGALKVLVLGVATLVDVEWQMSGHVILMVLLGGVGTFWGPVVGAIVIIGLENKLGDIGMYLASVTGIEGFQKIGESVPTAMGVIFILCVLVCRRGIVGEIVKLLPIKRDTDLSTP
ncbi:branched-chain amino acid ABC transporter permease [Ensifer sp. ENS04]|uniref:branched-chain amino acid ABC transporter permease n=1 Tax=Ensifer sp. ENS04 TaxID=2769281 RepID=UPI0017810184|nr:branched-chain amino acid ABC transporter permease [Ensifer sp. ENS04]MBD9541484.1 branched-chain amino acid ABC transporter permease [Ensifer sp. ENS04]